MCSRCKKGLIQFQFSSSIPNVQLEMLLLNCIKVLARKDIFYKIDPKLPVSPPDRIFFPWQRFVVNEDLKHFCTAVVLNRMFLLSSKNCVDGFEANEVPEPSNSFWRSKKSPNEESPNEIVLILEKS